MRKETNIYEQKPVNIDNFNEVGEKEVKEHVEKQRQKGKRQLKKILLEKKKRKQETKIREKDMWKRLNQLNCEFKEYKKSKKDAKKMSDTIIKH